MKGMIYTFYSYKGGVGRSMALANIAMHFFKQGLTTLVIDWDLEAPGLERYFEARYRFNQDDINDRPGLCDMLRNYMEKIALPPSTDEDEDEPPYPPVTDYLYELDKQDAASLWIMHSGRRAKGQPWEEYARFVQTFDWSAFYNEWEGGIYLEWLREKLKEMADVILIDSRTGVTEMGGVATQHLADVVVMLCGANLQNIENTARMALNFSSEAVKKARGNRPLDILVAPARIDDADSQGFREFLGRFKSAFADLPMRGLDDGFDMEEMLMPYLPTFSYRETLIIGDPEVETIAFRLMRAYQNIAGNMKLLAHEESTLKTGRVEPTASAQPGVFLFYKREDNLIAQAIESYLTERGVVVSGGDSKILKQEDWTSEMARARAVLVICTSATEHSTSVRRIVQQAERLSKPIIPLVVRGAKVSLWKVPIWLADRKAIDFHPESEEGLSALFRSIQALTEAPPDAQRADRPPGKMVFISYDPQAGMDKTSSRIAERLRGEGFRTWLSSENILPGANWTDAIEQAILESSAMVVSLNRLSGVSRDTVREWSFMEQLGKPIIPVLLEKTPLPFQLASMQIIDFTDDFDEGLDILSRALHQVLDGDSEPSPNP